MKPRRRRSRKPGYGANNGGLPVNRDVVEVLDGLRLNIEVAQADGPFKKLDENITRQWKRILRRANVKGVTVHDLRRTYVTRLIRAGVPLPTVQGLAGHSLIETTLKFYNTVTTKINGRRWPS